MEILNVVGARPNLMKIAPLMAEYRRRANIHALLVHTGVGRRVDCMTGLRLVEPLGYLDFLRLVTTAAVVLTDSGGIQEETTILNVPCLTLRDNTERPATVACGSNRIVGRDPQRIIAAYKDATYADGKRYQTPPLWDGQAARRIVEILAHKT